MIINHMTAIASKFWEYLIECCIYVAVHINLKFSAATPMTPSMLFHMISYPCVLGCKNLPFDILYRLLTFQKWMKIYIPLFV